MQHMTSGLQQLSDQAEKEHQEKDRKAKRPRKTDVAIDEEMNAAPSQPAALGAKALQPFAAPGQ